jgi:hypothetical protein
VASISRQLVVIILGSNNNLGAAMLTSPRRSCGLWGPFQSLYERDTIDFLPLYKRESFTLGMRSTDPPGTMGRVRVVGSQTSTRFRSTFHPATGDTASYHDQQTQDRSGLCLNPTDAL